MLAAASGLVEVFVFTTHAADVRKMVLRQSASTLHSTMIQLIQTWKLWKASGKRPAVAAERAVRTLLQGPHFRSGQPGRRTRRI